MGQWVIYWSELEIKTEHDYWVGLMEREEEGVWRQGEDKQGKFKLPFWELGLN